MIGSIIQSQAVDENNKVINEAIKSLIPKAEASETFMKGLIAQVDRV